MTETGRKGQRLTGPTDRTGGKVDNGLASDNDRVAPLVPVFATSDGTCAMGDAPGRSFGCEHTVATSRCFGGGQRCCQQSATGYIRGRTRHESVMRNHRGARPLSGCIQTRLAPLSETESVENVCPVDSCFAQARDCRVAVTMAADALKAACLLEPWGFLSNQSLE